MRNILILCLLSLFLSSCSQREEIGYYPTGEVEYRAPLDKQGVFEGTVTHFYKNGKVKSKLPFRNHHINGTIKRYDPMGHLVSTEVCKNGKTFGSVVIYYQNGQPKYKTVLHGNTHVDTTRLYYPNGELKQLIVYGAHGRKVDFGVWQPNGELDPSYIHPLLFSDTDTVQEGQDYAFEIVLGNRRSNVVDVKLLTPTKGLDSTRGTYANRRYLIRQPTLGQHMVKAEVREQWARKGSDTIWTNYYSVNHRFSVIGVLAKQNNSIE